jgi:hypothetical protein
MFANQAACGALFFATDGARLASHDAKQAKGDTYRIDPDRSEKMQ